MVKKSKNIFGERNPLSNLSNEKTKNFVKQFENNEKLKMEILKIEGIKLKKITRELINNIDYNDKTFINREIEFNILKKSESIKMLAESIKEIGLINPVYLIEKSKNKYIILSGYRRLTSIYYGYENIEEFDILGMNNVVIIPENTSYEILDKISLHENTLRENLTLLEISNKIWKESKKNKKSTKQIALEYGLSERTVSRYLRVEKYPEELLNNLEKINNIRKSDSIYSYLKLTNFENIKNKIKKLKKLEISEIEEEIKAVKDDLNDNINKIIFIKKGKNKTIFEIEKNLTDSQIKKIKDIIMKKI